MRRLLVAVVLGGLLLARPAAAEDQPTLTTDRPAYERGQSIRVDGEGWPARQLLTVELCGNEAARGSVDCDARNAATAATAADGTFFADLLASSPPSPCPCVVHVFSPGGTIDMGVRVRIEGVPVAEVTAATMPTRRLEVTDLELTRDDGLATWFGGAPSGTLRATVANTGDVPVDDASLRVRWGRSPDGTRVVDVGALDALAPGETMVVDVAVELEPLAFGRYVLSARVTGFAGTAETTTATAYPFGLVVLAVVLAAALVALRVRRSRRPAPAPAAKVTPAPAEPAPAPKATPVRRPRRIPVPVRAGALVVVVAVALAAGLVRGCGDDERGPVAAEDLCAELRAIDPGRSFAGASAERLAAAAVRVHALVGRVPEEVAGAVRAIAERVDEDPAVLDLPDLDQGDDGYTAAYQAAYALRFDSEVTVGAALLERYAVDECGLAPSGSFDIDAVRDRDLDAAEVPVLTQEDLDELRAEFTPTELDGYELEPFEIPEVELDGDIDGTDLDVPVIPEPDLGP